MAKPVYLFSFLFLLFACEEDLTTLGFKSDQNKLKVYYAEIPIATSVLLMDSLRTSTLTGETNRLLVGSYTDPEFGTTQAQAVMHIVPSSLSKEPSSTATYDSVVFRMRFDFYAYGNNGTSDQIYNIYEVANELDTDVDFYSNSEVVLGKTILGTKKQSVNYNFFKQEFDDTDTDSLMTITVKLNDGYGRRLFSYVDIDDVNYTNFDLFKQVFKGLVVVASQADKIVGLSPTDLNSFVTLYYHEGTTAQSLTFSFSGATFSKLSSDRSSTALSGLTQFNTDYNPGISKYVQAGTSIVTKLDFSKFYEYMDTIPYMIVNSVELNIPGAEISTITPAPSNLALTLLRNNNHYKSLKTEQDTLDYVAFNGMAVLSDQTKFYAGNDQGGIFSLAYSATDGIYSGTPSLFFQKLFDIKSTKFPYWALRPLNPHPSKAVDRTIFNGENIKLKIYYTRAILETQ